MFLQALDILNRHIMLYELLILKAGVWVVRNNVG